MCGKSAPSCLEVCAWKKKTRTYHERVPAKTLRFADWERCLPLDLFADRV